MRRMAEDVEGMGNGEGVSLQAYFWDRREPSPSGSGCKCVSAYLGFGAWVTYLLTWVHTWVGRMLLGTV